MSLWPVPPPAGQTQNSEHLLRSYSRHSVLHWRRWRRWRHCRMPPPASPLPPLLRASGQEGYAVASPPVPLELVAQPQLQTTAVVKVRVPPGGEAGTSMKVLAPDGQEHAMKIPPGKKGGDVWEVSLRGRGG